MTTPAHQTAMSHADWAKLLLLGAIWGGSFFFARIAVQEIAPLTLVLLRVAIAAAALHVWLAATGVSARPMLARPRDFLVMGLINNVVPFSLIFAGQTELGAGLASVLNATTPFWTILAAAAFAGARPVGAGRLAGILLGIAGTAVMVGPGLVSGLGGPVWPKLALIGASLSYAAAALYARRFAGLPPALVAAGQLTASSLMMLPVALLAGGLAGLGQPSPGAWAAVLGLALVSTAFAYILYFGLIASAGATNTSLVTLIVPASAMLLGTIFLGERLDSLDAAGMTLIVLGLIAADGRIFARLTKNFRRLS